MKHLKKLLMAPTKWSNNSEFPPTATILDASQIVGLQSGSNVKWAFSVLKSNILAAMGLAIFGEMYFHTNAINTNFSAVNTPTKIAGTYISGALQGFTQAAGTLTFNATNTTTLTLTLSMSVAALSNPVNLTFFVYLNGVAVANIKQDGIDFNGVIPSQVTIPLSGAILLATGNTIEIYVQNNTDATSVLFRNLNCLVSSGASAGSNAGPSGTYIPIFTGNINATLIMNAVTRYTAPDIAPGSTCIINTYFQYTPVAPTCRVTFSIPPGVGGNFTNALDATLIGGTGFDASFQMFFSDFRPANANTGAAKSITVGIQVPSNALNVANGVQCAVSYTIRG